MSKVSDKFNYELDYDQQKSVLNALKPIHIPSLTPKELEEGGPMICLGLDAKMYWESDVVQAMADFASTQYNG